MVMVAKNCTAGGPTPTGVLACGQGALMHDTIGQNCDGVVMAWEKVATREDRGNAGAMAAEDLLRVGVATSGSADDCLEAMVEALEQHDGGVASMQMLVVDKTKCWVFEAAGEWWVAEMVADGTRILGCQLSVGPRFQRSRQGIREYAERRGFWLGMQAGGAFNFAEAFSLPSAMASSARHRVRRIHEILQDQEVTVTLLAALLRDHNGKPEDVCVEISDRSALCVCQSVICMVGSMIDENMPPISLVTCSPDPRSSVFKPFLLGAPEPDVCALSDRVWESNTRSNASCTPEQATQMRKQLQKVEEWAWSVATQSKIGLVDPYRYAWRYHPMYGTEQSVYEPTEDYRQGSSWYYEVKGPPALVEIHRTHELLLEPEEPEEFESRPGHGYRHEESFSLFVEAATHELRLYEDSVQAQAIKN
eukprot:TRINITY_DN60921_c0_g1_i1.p1 TRINITY_DN60921_c0_g1~~TRINITY_DN60921_c0_g1_i1.p1  ORF type:complete len:420 (+),score=53.76 TRINITY_DN60921_c0_g1_i1:150-1409(+)